MTPMAQHGRDAEGLFDDFNKTLKGRMPICSHPLGFLPIFQEPFLSGKEAVALKRVALFLWLGLMRGDRCCFTWLGSNLRKEMFICFCRHGVLQKSGRGC